MARAVSKASNLQLTISASLTTISQLEDFEFPEVKNTVMETASLDDAVGPTKTNTGYVDVGEFTFNGYFSKAQATHEFITDTIQTGATAYPIAGKVVNSDATEDTFSVVGMGIKKSVPAKGVVKMSGSLSLTGQITFAT